MNALKNKFSLKICSIYLLEIAFTLLLSFFAGVLVLIQLRIGLPHPVVTATTTIFVLMFSTYLAIFSLSRTFVLEDIHRVPQWLAIMTVGWGILFTALNHSFSVALVNIVIYPAVQYVITYIYLKAKFKRALTAPL